MSSTNRGAVRNNDDYYITPLWLASEFLAAYAKAPDNKLHSGFVLDPCCGGDDKHPATYVEALKAYDIKPLTVDIRSNSRAEVVRDFLTLPDRSLELPISLIISNPPFNLAVDFVHKSLKKIRDGGHVVFLQSLNWMGSKTRRKFWKHAPLKRIYTHSRRPSFNPETKNSDSINYAHYVFEKGYEGPATIEMIDSYEAAEENAPC